MAFLSASSAPTEAAMQPLQMQIANGVNNNNDMISNNGMGFMAPQQFGVSAGAGVNGAEPIQKTLELKAVCSSLRPNDFGGHATNTMASQLLLFNKLPREQATLLTLIECFSFKYRNRLPHEMSVMPNAALYYSRLSRADSPLKHRMEDVVGFRCCACRHTSQAPGQYMVGSTQLICMDFFNARSAVKMMGDLKAHIFKCPLVPKHAKDSLATSTALSPNHSSMEDYIDAWHKSFLGFSKVHGYPKLGNKSNTNNGQVSQQQPFQNGNRNFPTQMATNAATNRSRIVANMHNSNNLANDFQPIVNNNGALSHAQVMQEALKVAGFPAPVTYQQQQQPPPLCLQTQNALTTQKIPTVVPVETEDEAFRELDDCITTALSSNNFGLEMMKSRTLATDLTELPISEGSLVSPLLELLLQSYCMTLRAKPSIPEPSKKRSAEEMEVVDLTAEAQPLPEQKQSRGPKVYFECGYCDCEKATFCITTGNAREAATFIASSGLQHLAEECKEVPYDVKQKLNKLKESKVTVQKNHALVENHFASWKTEFDTQTQGKANTETGGPHVRFWRPLSWSFIEQVGASAISDKDGGVKGERSPLLPEDPSKKLPYAQRDVDVLVGWNGAHIGNRLFMDLLNEFKPAYLDEGMSERQQKVIAGSIVGMIWASGGRFYSVSSNYATVPPVPLSPEKATLITLDILKHGAYLLLQPTPDCTKTGRGSRVLDCEYAPQRDVFGTEIIRNKRYKLAEPLKDGPH